MPGSRVVYGERIGGTPLLRLDHMPIWDRVHLGTSPTADTNVFITGQVADTNAVNGVAKTNIDTSLLKGSQLPTPQFFDAIGLTITVTRAAVNTSDQSNIGILDIMRWRRAATFRFKVGPTPHVDNVRADFIPAGPDIDGFAGNVAAAAFRIGKGMQADQYPLRVPEEAALGSGANAYTGRMVPIKILPGEQFSGLIHLEAASLASFFDRALAVVVVVWGFLKSEK